MDPVGETRDPVEVPLAALVAAVCAALSEDRPPALPGRAEKGVPAWKRAALAELVLRGTDIREFI